MNPTMIALLVVLLVLVVVAGLLVAGLLFMRQRRRARKQMQIGDYEEDEEDDEKRLSASSTSSHRRVKTRPSESIHIYEEKKNLIDNSDSPPPSPLPQITITFPEEYDESGKRKSGRVVVVRVGDAGVALESSEALPAYQQDEKDRFQSIDLQRVGGLVEKARNGPNYKI
ncbi:uncharacterized protein RCC_05873 [Ramularia collo-cygni]|uniref:Uncharacterized protein n=1 Tax=Ramularia collo-cygni TaxID=112498 RepID=A0A2D3V8S9_9PEZI|nr:uncharacterized protein RCC_05873 [Ramularia collo-cygni]CZT20016.1 uncharacterized protein RCC_05873 [Ramularia collo-cygni]